MESEVDLLKCFEVDATPARDKEDLSGSRDLRLWQQFKRTLLILYATM